MGGSIMVVDISDLFTHFMELVNLQYYTKSETDDKYLVKQNFGLIIDSNGILKIVSDVDTDGNEIYVGDLYALKSELPVSVSQLRNDSLYVSKDELLEALTPMTVTLGDGTIKNVYVIKSDFVEDEL